MKRWCFPFASALAALLLLAGTVGCAESGETYAAFAPEESDRLVVYTSHKPEVYGPIVEEFESRTGIWVAVETGGTNELLARIEKEAEAPVCDIMFGGGVESLESYKACFDVYESAEEPYLLRNCRSKDHTWAPFTTLPFVLIYNKKLVSAKALSGWRDLVDPKWKGRIAFADPANSGSSYTALATLCQVLPGTTEEVLARFAENLDGRQCAGSGDGVDAVADGTLPIGVTLEETALKRIEAGEDIELLYPVEGTSAVPDGTAIIKGAPHADNARRFLDFVIGADVQKRVDAFCRRSVRTDVQPSERLIAQTELKLIDYNLTWASASHDAILLRWTELTGNGGGA